MEIKEFPGKMDTFQVDHEHLHRVFVSGLFRERVTVNDDERIFLTYLTPELEYARPVLVCALPAGVQAETYFETAGLKELADREKFFLLMALSDDGWSSDDVPYINALYAKAQARDYYAALPDNIYLAGIGDAASVVHAAASRLGDWSGVASFGEIHAVPDNQEITLPMPVWMQVSRYEGKAYETAQYWRKRNLDTDEALSSAVEDYIYLPEPIRRHSEINEEQTAQVRVAVADEMTVAHLERAWNFLRLNCRHRGQGGKQLRSRKDPADFGAEKRTITVDGLKRLWYEYVPAGCTPDKKWPVVLVMHGRGGSAETFFDLSGMSAVADDRKFIAVFPEAGVYRQKPGGLGNISLWCGTCEGKPVDDVKFIRALLADLEQRLPADRTRIYACGQSSGGMMSDVLGHTAGELFAAVASWSALRAESILKRTFPESECGAPLMWIFGDHDPICSRPEADPVLPFGIQPEMRQSVMEKLNHFGLEAEKPYCWQTYPIDWCAFTGADRVPLTMLGRVNDMGHANYPELSRISYDQFLSRFSRDPDGTLRYCGRPLAVR